MATTVIILKSDSPKVAAMEPLPEDHSRYFHTEQAHATVPLEHLVSTKQEPARSVKNAHRLMRGAYAGDNPKRAPITVRKEGEHYHILDGNATYGVAKHSGWSSLPVCLEERIAKAQGNSSHSLPSTLYHGTRETYSGPPKPGPDGAVWYGTTRDNPSVQNRASPICTT